MAKKNEFKPDKPYSGFISKLYLTQKQRKAILKWFLYGVLLLALSVLQDVILSRVSLFGATTDLVPCGIILICILEGVEGGCVFSLIAAMLFTFSGTAPGPYCIVLITALSIAGAIFRQSYLQKGFSAAMLCTGAATLLYELAVFLVGAFLGYTYWGRTGVFVLTGLLSLIAAPILYPVAQLIGSIGGESWKD